STIPALQDDLILSVIEQLKTQVVNYTKINQDNKKVNELLTAELERYINKERVLKEQMNNNQASTSYEHSLEIETLKHTLSKHLKEKESLNQKITLLKNDFQKEESRNINRELALEKQSVCLNVTACARCVTTESELKKDFLKKECDDMLLQKYHTLEKHCITLEINNQLNTKMFKRDTWSSQESALTFAELFEINNLKAQDQAKDSVILKLKEKLNSLNGDVKERKVKRDVEENKTLNIELDHKVTKLAAKNKHLKQTYKQLYDSIKSSRVRSKEQCDDLINKFNLKSAKVSDLNASLQEKVLVITTLKVQLNKLKGKAVLNEAISLNSIDPELLKVDVAPLVLKLRKNRTAHTDYIRHTQEEAATPREIVESERLLSPLYTSLVYACKYTR
nr:hypothetical protein [Tanacetum cinerariifolium]